MQSGVARTGIAAGKPRSGGKLILAYSALVGLPLTALLAALSRRPCGLSGPMVPGTSPFDLAKPGGAAAGSPQLAMLIAEIGLIILMSRLVGTLAEKIGQPRVIGETLAGILLGPSVLGAILPKASAVLFPPSSFGVLNSLSQLGLILFMFMIGPELNLKELEKQGPLAILVSHSSIASPMALGCLLAIYLYPRVSDASVDFAGFALFMGAAMSVTAFPVLARILSERGLLRTRIGSLSIACAAIDDVTGWCVLACIVAKVRASQFSMPLWMTGGGFLCFAGLMFWGARRRLRKIEHRYFEHGELPDNWKAFLLLFLLLSALITEMLGLHLLFGAFIAGAVMPKDRGFVSYVIGEFEPLTVLLHLPLFFAFTGLRTNIGRVNGFAMWSTCLLIIAVAVIGKLGGTSIAARTGGIGWREALGIGALMNTRGLMELVVLNIGSMRRS